MKDSISHKKIAKNTITLYIRGLISVVIGLYTSRIIIDILGVDNYGIYGLAGGIVASFGFINSSMAGSTSRFITFALGEKNYEKLKSTFANALSVHIIIAGIIILLGEAIGVWFLNYRLKIPTDNIIAANWVFQLSILSTCINITQVPYSALIISHEKMSIYAYMEIANVILKLLIVYLLIVIPGSKLIVYSVLVTLVSVIIALSYRIYCIRHFPEAKALPKLNRKVIKPMLSFSGWDFYGNMCVTARVQGTNFIINIFFGVAVNGAASIAAVINSVITGFSANVITAFRPQIIKTYAQKSWASFQHLINLGSQSTAILLCVMAIPLIFETHFIFSLWLGEVPQYVVDFCRITILTMIFGQINSIITIGIHATGKMKAISFISGSFYLITLPIMYLFFHLGYNPPVAYIIIMISMIIILGINIGILKFNIPNFNVTRLIKNFLLIILVCIPDVLLSFILKIYLNSGFIRFIIICLSSILSIGTMSYFLILDSNQKQKFCSKIIKTLKII